MSGYPASYCTNEADECFDIVFRDFPSVQCVTYAIDDVELDGLEGLKIGIMEAMDENVAIPTPSPLATGEVLVHLPLLIALKVALHNAMITTGTRKAELARKLSFQSAQMERLLDVNYASKAETLEQALYLLGYEVNAEVKKIEL